VFDAAVDSAEIGATIVLPAGKADRHLRDPQHVHIRAELEDQRDP
jgi:hypothetical protein